jgi:signal peptidase I
MLEAAVRQLSLSTLAAEALAQGVPVRFRATGDSMYPTIRDGEVIRVAPVADERIGVGDIVLYRAEGGVRLLAHRLVAISETPGGRRFHLRGDAKGGCDAPLPAAEVIGRVEAVSRGGIEVRVQGRLARTHHIARATAIALTATTTRGWAAIAPYFCYSHATDRLTSSLKR